MKFEYVGDDDNAAKDVVVKGVEFKKGKASEVPSELEGVFTNHPHFAQAKAATKKKVKAKAEEVEAEKSKTDAD